MNTIDGATGVVTREAELAEVQALLVENTAAAWLAALDRMSEAGLRTELAARGSAWAATRTIEAIGPRWAKLWGAA